MRTSIRILIAALLSAMTGLVAQAAAAAGLPDDLRSRIAAQVAPVAEPAPDAADAEDAAASETLPLGVSSSAAAGVNPDPLGGSATRSDAAVAGGSAGGAVLSTAGALGLVIGLVLAGRWAAVRFGGAAVTVARPSPAVEVLSRTAVAPKNHVLLLRVGRRVLVVNDAGQGLRRLAEIDADDEVADLLRHSVAASRGGAGVDTDALADPSARGEPAFRGLLERFGRPAAAADGPAPAEPVLDALAGVRSRLRGLGASR